MDRTNETEGVREAMSDMGAVPPSGSPRVQEFRNEIDGLKLKGGSAEGEQRLLALGVILMVVGIGFAIFGAIEVGLNGDSPADQFAYMAQGSFVGVAFAIVGGALFVRYSLARYLRFWLIRSTYEQQANTDRIVDAIDRAAGPIDVPAPQYVVPAAPPASTVPVVSPSVSPAPPAPPVPPSPTVPGAYP